MSAQSFYWPPPISGVQTESKFQVGDRVRIVNRNSEFNGMVGPVVKINLGNLYAFRVAVDGVKEGVGFRVCELEAAP